MPSTVAGGIWIEYEPVLESALTVPMVLPFSTTVTRAPGSATPYMYGMVFLVNSSELVPLVSVPNVSYGVPSVIDGAAACVSTTTWTGTPGLLVLPATSTATAENVYVPSASEPGTIDQLPDAPTVAVPTVVVVVPLTAVRTTTSW
ncbi:Uncharacterised protein [Burkholderia pseudomallei]|nr:Uncharacterised protein [Burkholderia pseudomallei]